MKLHARNVEELYREKGPAQASMEIHQIVLENINAMHQQMNELTQVCNQLIDAVGAVASGYKNLRFQVEKQRGMHQDDLPDNI